MALELDALLLGAIIGAVSTAIGYWINYLLRMREVSITREFEMYQKGIEYLQCLYGFLSVLFDLVDGYVRAKENGRAQISDTSGFIYMKPNQIVKNYKMKYEEFTKFMGEGKKNGCELFLRTDLAREITDFWALADFFYETGKWDKYLANKFDLLNDRAIKRIEYLLGISREKLDLPKWLKPSGIRAILRAKKNAGK